MKHKFTKEELYEIEKFFDMQAGVTSERMANVLNSVGQLDQNKKMKKKQGEIFDAYFEAWDGCKSISAKATLMRKEMDETKDDK